MSQRDVSDILGALGGSDEEEQPKEKKTRTANKESKKKKKKVTKKEKEIIDIAENLEMPDEYHLINTEELLDKLVNYYKTYKTMFADEPFTFLDTETYGVSPFKDPIISISIGFMSDEHFNIPLRPFKHEMSTEVPTLDFDLVVEKLKPLLEDDKHLILANSKFDIHVLHNWCGIDITYNIFWDTVIAGGLLNENHNKGLKDWYMSYALPDMVEKGLVDDSNEKQTFKFGKLFDKTPFDEVPHNLATYYACHDTYMTKAVFLYQKEVFDQAETFDLGRVWKLFREVEMPLIAVFATAERRGVQVDGEFLQDTIGGALKDKMQEILWGKDKEDGTHVNGIYDHLGAKIVLQKKKQRQKNGIKYKEDIEVVEDFNLNSPKQVVQKLYTEQNILEPVSEYDSKEKKKVPKYKTDKKTLNKNKSTHPVIPLLLEYRGLSKLISSFCEKLPKEPMGTIDGRVHASYNQLVKTGRVSCSDPNLNLRAA